jgi:hypothetical protein
MFSLAKAFSVVSAFAAGGVVDLVAGKSARQAHKRGAFVMDRPTMGARIRQLGVNERLVDRDETKVGLAEAEHEDGGPV